MRVLCLLPIIVACGGLENRAEPVPRGDLATFLSEVQPLLDRRCASPNCHGSRFRPLEIYAVQKHRIDEEKIFREEPLTPIELQHNYERACIFLMDLERAEECTLLSKPLSSAVGGTDHVGGTQFPDKSDREYQVLLRWVESSFGGQGAAP